MIIEQISVFVENKPGKIAAVTETLAKASIDLRAMSIADTQDFGILRFIVDKTDAAVSALKENGYLVTVTPVLSVSLDNRIGGLSDVLAALSAANIAVEYMYAYIGYDELKAHVVLRVPDNATAESALKAAGMGV